MQCDIWKQFTDECSGASHSIHRLIILSQQLLHCNDFIVPSNAFGAVINMKNVYEKWNLVHSGTCTWTRFQVIDFHTRSYHFQIVIYWHGRHALAVVNWRKMSQSWARKYLALAVVIDRQLGVAFGRFEHLDLAKLIVNRTKEFLNARTPQ